MITAKINDNYYRMFISKPLRNIYISYSPPVNNYVLEELTASILGFFLWAGERVICRVSLSCYTKVLLMYRT